MKYKMKIEYERQKLTVLILHAYKFISFLFHFSYLKLWNKKGRDVDDIPNSLLNINTEERC